jgi:hypothetical protein
VPDPPPDAYSRVTNPERYRPLHAAADALVAELVATFVVAVDHAPDVVPEYFDRVDLTRCVALTPEGGGAPIVVGWTAFPGVVIAHGWWSYEPFPGCGCDACDEDPAELVRMMHQRVADITAGQFQESLTLDLRQCHEFPNSSGWTQLMPDQVPAGAVPGTRSDWQPWRRQSR